MRYWSFCILGVLLLFASFSKVHKKKEVRWIVTRISNMSITGKTNVSGFVCAVSPYKKPDTLRLSFAAAQRDAKVTIDGAIDIELNKLDCRHRLMTRELQQILKTSIFPTAEINFVDLDSYPQVGRQQINGNVELTLVGITKRMNINYQVISTNKGFTLSGAQRVCFSDFKLKTPTKMGGLVKAVDQLIIAFEISVETK